MPMPNELPLTSGQKAFVTRTVNEIKKSGKQKMDDLYGELKVNLESKINELSSKLEEFSNFYEDLFNGDEENESMKAEIEGYIKNLTGKLDDIQTKYDTLIDGDDGIIKHNETAKTKKDEIEGLLDEVNPLVSEFNKYYDKVFGKEDENGNRKGGLKEEIEIRAEEYVALKKKIESLLPGATSAGLASAYESHKKTFKKQKRIWTIIFLGALAGMIKLYLWYDPQIEIQEWWGGLIKFLVRVPITIPCVWLASFSGKQQNKYQRLEQEYAYKESLCRSFEGYRKEIESLEDSESAKKLQVDLFNVIIQMSSYNPSITLESKSNNEKSPYGTIFEKILEKMDEYLKTANSLLENIGKISK